MNFLSQQLGARLEQIRNQGLERKIVPLQMREGGRILHEGREYVNLASNDYLGLSCNRELVTAFYDALSTDNLLDRFGPGSTASRLMTGNHPVNMELESRLNALYSPAKALVFNSGYHANVGLLPVLAGKDDLILADKLCHASLIDGMRLSRATVLRYPHLDYERLESLLAERRNKYRQVFVVTESVFSMDGDLADLQVLARLKQQHQAVLYVDEAHAVGIRGGQGLGLAEDQQVLDQVDILLGTFGKAYGGQGAFVICSRVVCDFLLNTVRSFIFTTGLPPVSLAWLVFVLEKLPQMHTERQHVQNLSDWLRGELSTRGLVTSGGTNIVPVMVGDSTQAVLVAERLRGKGFWVNAVRPPTVPAGTSRLRLSLTASMNRDILAPLPELIAQEI